MNKILRYSFVALLAMVGLNVMATDVTDELTLTTFGVTGTSYKDVTGKKATSAAVYAANIAGGNSAIQLRSNTNSGIVTTTSAGKVKSITIEWNSNTVDARVLKVYGSSTAYSAPSDLYSDNQGTEIASFKKSDGTKTETITGDYQYIGFRSNSGAMYIDKITIVWEDSGDITAAPSFSPKGGMYFDDQQVELSCSTEGAEIFYTLNGDDPTASSTKYTTPIAVTSTTTIKAIAIKGTTLSSVVNATYTIVKTETKGTVENPFSVADALTVIAALADKATSPVVYTQGYVVGDITVNNGQASFQIGATAGATENLITVFKAKGLENENYVADDATAGDLVVINAALQKYVKENVVTPETQYGFIYSINGETSKTPPTLVGDGSENNPFTANDLIIMKKSQRPTEAAWVKGIIRGSFKSKTELDTEDKASNIAIATSAEATEFAPVELKNGSVFREKLNVLDNATNKGKEVLIKGTIDDYFSVTGIKDIVEAKLDGEVISGIANITAAKAENGARYNLAGQKVNAGYKGLVIMNGQKVVLK